MSIEITRFVGVYRESVQVELYRFGSAEIPVYIDLPTDVDPRYRIDAYDPATGRHKRTYRKTESGVESVVERHMVAIGYPLDPGALLMAVGGWSFS